MLRFDLKAFDYLSVKAIQIFFLMLRFYLKAFDYSRVKAIQILLFFLDVEVYSKAV